MTSGYVPSRRGFLAAGAGLVAGALATSCSGPPGPASDVRLPTPPDPANPLPKGDVTLRLLDSGDTKTVFWDAFTEVYHRKHPNITVEYDGLPWNRIDEILPVGLRNESAHDLFQLSPTLPPNQAFSQGWLAPFDDVIPDFEEWKGRFPNDTFAEGRHLFDGKLYVIPLATDQRHQAMLHFNTQVLNDAGYDPGQKPLTWDEFRAAARVITRRGKGQAYGLVLEIAAPDRLSMCVGYLARAAGAASVDEVDLRTGEFFHTQDGVVETIEFLLSLRDDGSLLPGSNSMDAPKAWPRVLRGNAGMVFAGPWTAAQWERDQPTFGFGVGSHPVPDRDAVPVGYPVIGGDALSLYSGSELKSVAGDILDYVTSLEGQTAWGDTLGVANPPVLPQAREANRDGYSAVARTCDDLAEAMVANPDPVIRNPDVAVVLQEEKPATPGFGEVIQGVLVGEITDVRKALRDLKDRRERLRDDAVDAARAKGAKVAREDWAFGNWDPREDYTRQDYQGL